MMIFPSPIPAAINHLLAPEAWARAKLAAHAGKVACLDAGVMTVRLKVTPDGMVQAAARDDAPNVTIRVNPGDLPLIAQNRERAFSYVKVEGDADFANAISQLSQSLKWEADEDLSKWVGDIAAMRIVGGARAAFDTQ
jgi:ubiquinone biosynthesis protein UbiJ